MSNAEMLREAVRLHALAITPVDRLATYLLMVATVRAIQQGAYEYLVKPLDIDAIVRSVKKTNRVVIVEQGAQGTIKDGIAYCESVRDYVSRDILQDILDDTEEHIDFLETQIDLLGKVGLQNYLQSMMGEPS